MTILLLGVVLAAFLRMSFEWRARAGDEDELRHLNYFAAALNHLALGQNRIPGPTLADAVREVKQYLDGHDSSMILWDQLERGVDARGRPLIFEWVTPGQFLKIRSVGYNGRDDHGSGDDLPVIVDIRDWVASNSPTTQPKREKASANTR